MVHVMHMHFMFFAVFKNLKSSFPEDNMPEHAHWKHHQNGLGYPIKHEKWYQMLR